MPDTVALLITGQQGWLAHPGSFRRFRHRLYQNAWFTFDRRFALTARVTF